MVRRIGVILCVLMFLFAGTALAQTAAKGEAPKKAEPAKAGVAAKKGGTLVFGRGGDSVGLDPAYETDGNSFMICDNVYEALVFYREESTEIEPALATSWDVSPDGLQYTFKLRKGVKFHDGTPFNSDAVVFSLGRQMKEPKVKFFGKALEIPKEERPAEYWRTMEMDNTVGSIEAVDEYTVVFKLKRIEAPFLANLGMDYADIISPTAFLKDPKGYLRNPVGTGPYKFVEWKKDDRIVLEAFKDYWDKSKGPFMNKVVFRCIPENSVRFLELKAGKIHICQFPNAADIPLAKQDRKLQVFTQPGMNIGYLGFNHKKEPWKSNVKLRKAVAHAINRKAIVDNIYQGMGELAKNAIPPFMWGYNKEVPGYEYNVDLAKKLLSEAGYPEGKGLPEITLWSMPVARPYNPEGLKVGVAMIGDLKKIGINARIVSYDWGTYLKRQREQPDDMDLFQLGWTGDNGDPDNFLAVLFDGMASEAVRTQWHSEVYHKLMLEGKQTVDQDKRAEIYKKAQQLMFDECPVIPIAHSMVMWPGSKKVMNYKLHPTGSVLLRSVWLQ